MHVLIHFTYIFFKHNIALTYIHYLIDDLPNMLALKQFYVYTLLHMYDFDTIIS